MPQLSEFELKSNTSIQSLIDLKTNFNNLEEKEEIKEKK